MKVVIVSLIILSLFGCVTIEEQEIIKSQFLSEQFDAYKFQVEGEARNGEITWVKTAIKLKNYDKQIAENLKNRGFWKFDDDIEYHAYVALLAEQLDMKKITYLQFDAKRTNKFNNIRKERTALDNKISVKREREYQPTRTGNSSSTNGKTASNGS